MLRRCVGFSWAKPLCYEKRDASPCVHSVIPHAGSPARSVLFEYFVVSKSHIQNKTSLFAIEKDLFWKDILEALIFNKGETLKEYGTIFFSNISLFQFEEGYDSFSILAFSILKMLPFAILTLSFFQFKGIEMRLVSYPFSLKIQYVPFGLKDCVQRPSAGAFFV